MKKLYIFIITIIHVTYMFAQDSGQQHASLTKDSEIKNVGYNQYLADNIGQNGFRFESVGAAINTKYSDFSIGLFREKFISYSSNKIGVLTKSNPLTNEPYANLYCSNITAKGDLRRPLLFSNILNKGDNMGSATFSKDESTIFYTVSTEENPDKFKLFRADIDPKKWGRWIDIVALPFNSDEYSIENPHLSQDGFTLYFASNMPGSLGGYDIFQVAVNSDGSYGSVSPVEGKVNTSADEKFPHLSPNEKYLYFSSNGHKNIGGFDVFRSRKYKGGYSYILNLGNTINTEDNEVAYVPTTMHSGYYSSNKKGGEGGYDVYLYKEMFIPQKVKGTVRDYETNVPLEKILVSLIDADGNQEAVQITDTNGQYSFPVEGYEEYKIIASRNGFDLSTTAFNTNTKLVPVFNTQIILKTSAAPIVKNKNETYLEIDNIHFEYNSSRIEPCSMIILNRIARTLIDNPKINIDVKAHTDIQGSIEYNQELSQLRSKAAVNYLISKGIAKNRIAANGFGKSEPIIICDSCKKEEHEANQRIEFIVLNY